MNEANIHHNDNHTKLLCGQQTAASYSCIYCLESWCRCAELESSIGFVAVRDIEVGAEVVWDYQVRGEVWSGCRLVDGRV